MSEPEEPEEQTVFLRLRELCALPVTPVQIIEFTDKLLLTPRRSRRATVDCRNEEQLNYSESSWYIQTI